MIVLQTIAVAFAMFSAIPVPQFDWNEKNMRYAMCAFPLIGAVIGAAWCVCGVLPLPGLAKAAGFALVPVWVTGGIHLDGYADTCDALSSYGDRTKKLEILKDPHCGAFAVIRLCSYFLAYFALCTCVQFTPRVGALWALALVLERALSGYAVASFPMAKNTGLAHTFATAADKTAVRRVLAVLAAVLCVGMAALGGWALALVLERALSGYAVAAFPMAKNTGLAHTFATAADKTAVRRVLAVLAAVLCVGMAALGGWALVLAALAVLWRYHAVSRKQFGGITGDLAGWFLQKAELWMLAALCACQWGGLL